ncbi:hypothetical protein EST38_g1723 [Candolleomyces aberdarensis]|uniref:Man1/Src1 C-terminal domain-containing protein n=1 Tax=Candolleomyces aberdarensis TaxID=2316362 RepID=A0A4Q2DWT7_9AGAR|nr:hypothetical protein EST38_g1723 [Candolleomyces aberdarensis]
MSRLTSAQVISLGEYLEPDFNPSSLTVSQLLGVLGYHNIPYPTPYSKPKLVQLFNDEIKARSVKFKKERLKKVNSLPSDDGIMDGVTGKPLNGGRKEATPSTRSSRRLSQAPVIEVEDSPPSPPKRRRSSAQPALGGTSRRRPAIQPTLKEESESEDEIPPPPKKVGRTSKTAKAPRISDTFGEDSGWEDNNIFQSGAESSSPIRPSPVRAKMPDSSPTRSSPFSPPQSSFNPALGRLPPLRFSPSPAQRAKSPDLHQDEPSIDELNIVEEIKEEEQSVVVPEEEEEVPEEELILEDDEEVKEEEDEDFEPVLSADLQNADRSRALIAHIPHRSGFATILSQMVAALIVAAVGYVAFNYKTESASIGFCDTGSTTNNALEALRGHRLAIEACNRDNRTTLNLPSMQSSPNEDKDSAPCPLPPLVPLPLPNSCTPCPQHGTCEQFSVQCDNGYILRPNALLSFLPNPPSSFDLSPATSVSPSELAWALISQNLNGLPGLGSIALPPRCAPDPKRQRNIGVLGKAMKSLLDQERGRRLCVGGDDLLKEYNEKEGGEARKWGIEIKQLQELMKRKTSPRLKPAFDDTFNEAVQELVQSPGVVLTEDNQGHRYLASEEADLTWDCVVTVKSRALWAAWRTTALGGAVAAVAVILARLKVAQKQTEARQVSELVQIALDTLRNQELAHHTDPVSTPQPYLSSIQLRDVILQNEHSIPTRRRLWDQVEHVVEGNANVRANLEEIEGGDELRVWRWVGSTGRGLM